MLSSHRARLLAPLVLLGACGPGAPARFLTAELGDTSSTEWCVQFSLVDAQGQPTTSQGSLRYVLEDDAGAELCHASVAPPEIVYVEGRATVCARVPDVTCPVASPAAHRRLVVMFTPRSGGSEIAAPPIEAPISMFRAPPPPPVPTPTPPPAPAEVAEAPPAPTEVEGWVTIPALGARVQAPGARIVPARTPPIGASDVHTIGASNDCRVQLGRWPSLAVTGATTRARLVTDGSPITVDEVSAERWHLEYEAESFLYVSVGVVQGDTAIVCRADYPSGQDANRACAARICASLEVDPR
jgi:hypothetical protein